MRWRTLFPWLVLTASACADDGTHDARSEDAALPPLDSEPLDSEVEMEPASQLPEGPLYYSFPCSLPRQPTHEAAFTAIYVDIFCKVGCANPYCHGARGTWQGLDLSNIGVAYGLLVGKPAGRLEPVDPIATCRQSGLLRVKPYVPEESLLYLKLSGQAPCGTAMPPPTGDNRALSSDELDQVWRWISAGAPLHGADASLDNVADAGASF